MVMKQSVKHSPGVIDMEKAESDNLKQVSTSFLEPNSRHLPPSKKHFFIPEIGSRIWF